MLRTLSVCFLVAYASANPPQATVTIQNKDISGTIVFTQLNDAVLVEGEIAGLSPGKHGFHIHAYGDLSNGCTSAGPHFNPFNKTHGAPDSPNRHVGDLGNIIAGPDGIAKIHIIDNQISLFGETCIIGRAVVVHAGVDDLGLGGDEESLKTGNAGGRLGCGVIQAVSTAAQALPQLLMGLGSLVLVTLLFK